MSDNLEALLDTLGGLDTQSLRWQIEKLRAIKEWAVTQACDFAVGDRVEMRDTLDLNSLDGWAAYRETMAPGATATVRAIDFNTYTGLWCAEIVFDREWSCGSVGSESRYWHGPIDDTPDGFQPPSAFDQETYPDGRKHTFHMPVRHLRKIAANVSGDAGGAEQ